MKQIQSKTIGREELVGLLSSALGQKTAEESVLNATRALGLGRDAWSTEDALRILDALSGAPGLVGVTAHFAKSRAILVWANR